MWKEKENTLPRKKKKKINLAKSFLIVKMFHQQEEKKNGKTLNDPIFPLESRIKMQIPCKLKPFLLFQNWFFSALFFLLLLLLVFSFSNTRYCISPLHLTPFEHVSNSCFPFWHFQQFCFFFILNDFILYCLVNELMNIHNSNNNF